MMEFRDAAFGHRLWDDAAPECDVPASGTDVMLRGALHAVVRVEAEEAMGGRPRIAVYLRPAQELPHSRIRRLEVRRSKAMTLTPSPAAAAGSLD